MLLVNNLFNIKKVAAIRFELMTKGL
jgi:hypothetical protein